MNKPLHLFIGIFLLLTFAYILASLILSIFWGFTSWHTLIVSSLSFGAILGLLFTIIQISSLKRYENWQYEGQFIGGQYSKHLISSVKPDVLEDQLMSNTKHRIQLEDKSNYTLTFLFRGGMKSWGEIVSISWQKTGDDHFKYRIVSKPRFLFNVIDFGQSLKHIEHVEQFLK